MATNGLPQSELADFVYREARLLDEKRFDEWYELFTDDARYWMPLTRGQPFDETHTSLFYEDKLLLKVRIERLRHANAFSQQQPSFCQHILQHKPEGALWGIAGQALQRLHQRQVAADHRAELLGED